MGVDVGRATDGCAMGKAREGELLEPREHV